MIQRTQPRSCEHRRLKFSEVYSYSYSHSFVMLCLWSASVAVCFRETIAAQRATVVTMHYLDLFSKWHCISIFTQMCTSYHCEHLNYSFFPLAAVLSATSLAVTAAAETLTNNTSMQRTRKNHRYNSYAPCDSCSVCTLIFGE